MTTLVLDVDPVATGVHVDNEKLTIDLQDGRSLVIPLAWYPRLLHGSPAERREPGIFAD